MTNARDSSSHRAFATDHESSHRRRHHRRQRRDLRRAAAGSAARRGPRRASVDQPLGPRCHSRRNWSSTIDLDNVRAPSSTCGLPRQRVRRSRGEARTTYHHQDFMAPMASGSFLTGGMVICPCSGTTLSAVAAGAASNLIQRAAEVHLKERRKLIARAARNAAVAGPHRQHAPRHRSRRGRAAGVARLVSRRARRSSDLVDFVVARICDQLGVEHIARSKRWGERHRFDDAAERIRHFARD